MEPSKNKAFAILVGIFVLGIVTGLLGMRVYQQQTAEAGSRSEPFSLHGESATDVAKHLREKLDLSEEQTAHVEEILDDCIMREAELMVQTRQLKAGAKQQILELLTPEQRKQFEMAVQEASSY